MPQIVFHKKLTLLNEQTNETQSRRYARLAFSVPKGCGTLALSIRLSSARIAQIPVCLFDALGNVRIMKASNAVQTGAQEFLLSQQAVCEGGLPGEIMEGEWKLLLYKRRMHGNVQAEITVTVTEKDKDAPPYVEAPLTFAKSCPDTRPGWFKGELHTHSSESTGYTDVQDVVDTARELGLDFLALTDHFTASHWRRLNEISDGKRPLLLQSMEISGDCGHANVHGLTKWMNPLVDDNVELTTFLGLKERPSMNQLADEAHAQGALFCLNHALSGSLGWRYRDFDLKKADLYEAFCMAELDPALSYPQHFDMLLARGYRLTAVGSCDSHHPTREGPWKLGHVLTHVYAENLSQPALLKALKAGHAYIGVSGCEMDLFAQKGGQTYGMGDTLTLSKNEAVCVTARLSKHPKGNLFIYQDGMLREVKYFDNSAPVDYTFSLSAAEIGENSYVRAEFYEIEGELPYFGYAWRNYKTLRLLSNPIFLAKGD